MESLRTKDGTVVTKGVLHCVVRLISELIARVLMI